MAKHTLYLIDGHSYLYRAFHALPPLSNSKGLPTHVIYGFTHMLLKLIREKRPDYLAVAFDSGKPTHRHEAFEAYKAHRPPMPDPLAVQIPYVMKIVEAFRIPVLIQEGVEADDLIGTLAKQIQAQDAEVVIVTGDKDMFQLVSPRIHIYDSMRDKTYGVREVQEKFGVEPGQVVEVIALMGDAVDNIPGVPGVGEKTATELIRQFGTIDHLLARLDEVKRPKLRETLKAHADQIRLNRELASLHLDLPWKRDLARFGRTEPDLKTLTQLFSELEFSSLLRALLPSGNRDPVGPPARSPRRLGAAEFIEIAVQTGSVGMAGIISGRSSLGGLFSKGEPMRQVKSEPHFSAMDTEVRGIAFSCGVAQSLFVSPETDSGSVLRTILEDSRIKKVGHHLKPLWLALNRMGIQPKGIDFDTRVASYLLSPNRRSHDLGEIALEYLGRSIQPHVLVVRGAPMEPLEGAACEAAEAVLEISKIMEGRLQERGQSQLYREVEVPLIEVLVEMERNGVRVDVGLLGEISKELELRLQELVQKIYQMAQGEFNLNSPKQLAQVLFERLGLKPVRKTKTGYSTDEGVLTQLAQVHELPAELLNYRQLAKLKSTYVDSLPQMVNPRTGRLHTTFHQTVTATGRLSSSDPNLQNIPIRGEWGRKIRQAFIAEEGHRLLSADYNQIELRILAHIAQDEKLIQAFLEGGDIHTATASTIFKLPAHLISTEMRRAAKTVNFGVIYGMGPYALSGELGTSQAEAKQYIDQYFEHYEGVKRFVETTIQEARHLGYVTTLLKRRREVPELFALDVNTQNLGERIAVNTVIQGSAADLMKLAMVRIFRQLKQRGFGSKMILQIHDELVFEVPESELEPVKSLVKQEMEGVITLSVPIKVDLGVGHNWAEIH